MNSLIHELLAGGTAGAIGVVIGNPLDVIKIRMQTSPSKYFSSIQTFHAILQQEGALGFYKGMSSPVVAQFLMNSVLFATNSLVLSILQTRNSSDFVNSFVSGSVSGFAQCLILVPTDVIKCSIQVQSDRPNYFHSPQSHGAILCAQNIIKTEGISGLFKGFTATAMREVPAIGVYFTTYRITVNMLESLYSNKSLNKNAIEQKPSTPIVLFSGGMAGCMSWLMVYPIDVIKSNIQSSSANTSSNRTGLIETAKTLQRKYGWKIFTRGLGVTLLRAFPVNASTFYFYELFRSHLQNHLPV